MVKRIAVIGTGAGFTGAKEPPQEIAAVAGVGFRPELVETRLRAFPLTPFDRGLVTLAYMDAGVEAAHQGFDAVYINTVGDYGISELKSALDIPVVGSGEAAMSLACTLGRRFAIVTIWPPKLNFIYEDRLRAYGMEGRCDDVRNVLVNDDLETLDDEDNPVSRMRQGVDSILDRIVAHCHDAVEKGGADTVILGCTCMAPIGATVAARCSFPVIEVMTAGYKMAEMHASLGLAQSHAAFPKASPESLNAVGTLVTGGGGMDLEEGCEVCVITAEAAE